MKTASLIFVACVLCAIAYADIPDIFQACSFRLTTHMVFKSPDGDELGNSINEIVHDNGYWLWNSQFQGTQLISSILPNHEWGIVWRRDNGHSYRHDIDLQKCIDSTDVPTPWNWIESKTYGVVWFDEPIWIGDREGTLYTAAAAGAYGKYEYESISNFYVTNDDGNVVDFNGTVNVNNGEVEIILQTTRMSFEHNKPIDPRNFAVEAPCPTMDPPEKPDEAYQKQCYHKSGASLATISWVALLVALLAALLNF